MRYEEPKLLVIYLEIVDVVTISGTDSGDGGFVPGGGLLPQSTRDGSF